MTARPPSYCLQCARPRGPNDYGCPACGCDAYAKEAPATSVQRGADTPLPLRGPLAGILQPRPGVVLIAGPRGQGKSSLAIGSPALPARFITCEMDLPTASEYVARLGANVDAYRGEIDPYAPDLGLLDPRPSFIVLDSLQAHPGHPLDVLVAVRTYCQTWGVVAFITSQVTKAGKIAGLERIPHEVDAVVELDRVNAQPRATLTKNRFGPVGSVVWSFDTFDSTRQRWPPRFYTIEGVGPRYRAVAFPGENARYAGYLRAAAKDDDLRARLPPPPAALACSDAGELYSARWIEPPDVADRQRWATQHGLDWFSPSGTTAGAPAAVPNTEAENGA